MKAISNSDKLKDLVALSEATATAASSLGAVLATATATATAVPSVAEAGSKALIVVSRFQLLGHAPSITVSSLAELKDTASYLKAELQKFDTPQPEAFECPPAFDACMAKAKSRTQQGVCWMALIACFSKSLKGLVTVNVNVGGSSE